MTARSDSRNVDGRLSEAETSGDGVCLSGDVVVEDQSGRLAMIIEFVAIIVGVGVLLVILAVVPYICTRGGK